MTIKEQLLEAIRDSDSNSQLHTTEILDSGEICKMVYVGTDDRLSLMFNNYFNDNLEGAVPLGRQTRIVSWRFINL